MNPDPQQARQMNSFRNFNWPVFLTWILLSAFGLIAIYSATQGPVSDFLPAHIQQNFIRQVIWLILSIILVIGFQFIPPQLYLRFTYLFYIIMLILVGLTIFAGTEVSGAKSWLSIGPINVQASELMKLATVMATANYLTSRRNISAENIWYSVIAAAMILLPAILIILQNDMGTALVFIALIPVILFWSGLPYGYSLFIITPAIVLYFTLLDWSYGVAAILILSFAIFLLQKKVWLTMTSALVGGVVVFIGDFALNRFLQPHQISRIKSFINPNLDPTGTGWNIIQAKTAIGSGGLTGKGFLEGTQTQLRFLPAQWTDFISCVIGEEFGFIGLGLLIMIFLLFFVLMLKMAGSQKHPFAQLTTVGVTTIFFIHFLINLFSATALLPIIGLPLPFVSYGGSAMVSNSLMLAICLNMDLHKRDFSIYR